MALTDILKVDCIKAPLEATDKKAAIYELVDLLHEKGRISDAPALKEAIWQRESIRTTGMGHGLAVPHGKSASCDRLAIAIGVPAQPIDFQSIDGRPVSIIFLLASPPDQATAHIQVLASVSRMMVQESFRAAMFEAKDAQTIYDLIVSQEAETAE
ncbi:MAG: PTS sugar transporter subunit IIA [Planctomycetota bacterium]|jgi:fructose-specific phosphotransferase system IIA component